MFSFFKRSKNQKSKQKHDASASKVAMPSACVANALETQPTSPIATPMRLLDQEEGAGNRVDAKVRPTAENSGSGGEGESVKNKQHPPPTAARFSPNDIIRENGRSFDFEDGTGSVIEFADAVETDDEDAINECEQREDLKLLPLQIRGETNDPNSEQSASYNQNANLFESTMAKGKNKRRYQQQQQQNGKNLQNQQGQKQAGQNQHPNKDNHLLKTQTDGICEKQNTVTVEKVTQPAENVTKVQEINGEVNHSEHISNEEHKVKIVSKDTDSEQRPCLTAGDVNGNNVEVHEDKNSIVVRSDTNKPSYGDQQHDHSRRPDDGVSVTAEDTTVITSVTSPFPLTQTVQNDLTTVVGDAGVNELLKSINNDSVPSQCPATELHSSAITISHEIKDGLRDTINGSETVTSKDGTSDTEMGQQPSKPSEPASNNRRSLTPNRQLSSTISESPQRQLLAVQVKQDASRDDISDDRDVFYEATESLSAVFNPSSLDKSDPAVPCSAIIIKPAAQEKSPPPKAIISAHPGEPRVSPKKRVVFSDQLIIDGNPSQEPDSRSDSVSSASTESLPNALNLEPPRYEHVAKNNEEQVHAKSSSYESLVFNNSSNEVLSVGNSVEQSAFISDKSGISPSVPMIMSKPNLIEFRYDHSEPSAQPNGHLEEEKEKSQLTVINGDKELTTAMIENGTDLIMDEINSLPDVVQPTNIEKATKQPFNTVDKINSEMKELVNQESRYSVKLEDADKRASEAQTKVYELQLRLEEVEREVSMKECSVDRLKGELEAACKECESIRARLQSQNSEMEALRLKFSDREDELNLKYQNLEIEYLELNEKLKDVRQLAHELNMQLIDAQTVAETVRKEKDKLLDERAEEQKIITEALELALKERAQVDAKWKNDFEQLRTVNTDREEHLMEDCEWKIRSMQKNCKEKIETVERERKLAMDKMVRLEQESRKHVDEVKHLRSFEAEVSQLRGLTYDQKESLTIMTRQIDQLKTELEMANNKLEVEIVKVQQIKNRCEYQLCDKEREALNRIEIARGEIAMQWEDRLLHEMNRLKVELEQMHMEERISAINKIKREALEETEALKHKFNMRERQLKEEIESLKATIARQRQTMEQAQTDTDYKMVQSRMFVERAEREHETILEREVSKRDQIIENLKEQYEKEKYDMEQHFSLRIQQVQEEFQRELSDSTELLKVTHKKDLEQQWKNLVSEKEEALQLMESRHRNRLEDAENKISFEEMRMRYERRDPRPEDLQQIEELKSVIESQDRDLRLLTEQFREMQLHERELQQRLFQQQQQQQQPPQAPRRAKNRGKQQPNQQNEQSLVEDPPQQQQQQQQPPQIQIQPMSSSVPIVCDVIYEENEADLIKEEQEEQAEQSEAVEQVQPTAQPDQAEQIQMVEVAGVIVDVPESEIETMTSDVHSTEPIFIDNLPDSPTEQVFSEVEDGNQQEIPVIQIDQLPKLELMDSEVSIPVPTPSIIITEESGESTEHETEEVCITTVIELPTPIKPVVTQPPAEPAQSEFDEIQQKVQSMPEMIVIREPDVVAEAKAAVAATCDGASSVDVVVCSPGPRSSST
ncbi:interaptin-like isoform X2 [Ochlerotatus camptorhynchus]|uniref:interaptin-like isoform X2 n=1 Tax=Ochlerotatus camptorhynchus TaxID=644619 RepID=UPI0031DC9C67